MKNGGPKGSMLASATNSGTLAPPDEVRALFGDPPLLRGEDVGLYNELMGQFAKIVEPTDMIEWWWVKDITDHTWEIRRLRRFKALFVEVAQDLMLQTADLFGGTKNGCRCATAKRAWPKG